MMTAGVRGTAVSLLEGCHRKKDALRDALPLAAGRPLGIELDEPGAPSIPGQTRLADECSPKAPQTKGGDDHSIARRKVIPLEEHGSLPEGFG
jgi:hypothetical protein